MKFKLLLMGAAVLFFIPKTRNWMLKAMAGLMEPKEKKESES